jgi:hypothetical protein
MRSVLPLLLLLAPPAAAQPKAELPRVLLLGDSIRLGYAPLVAKKLAGTAIVMHPEKENGTDTANTLKHLDRWLDGGTFAVIHFNCGLHDAKLDDRAKTYQVPLDQYGANLKRIAERLRRASPNVIFATTAPVIDDRQTATGRKLGLGFALRDADVKRYNDAAAKTLLPLAVPVHDLNRLVAEYDPAKLLEPDGVHFTAAANYVLADAVADVIRRQLAVMNPTRLKPLASGPEAVAVYQKAEAELDEQVPAAFKALRFPSFDPPKSADEWAKRRPDVKAKVVASLGDLPPRPAKPTAHLVSAESRDGFHLERLRIDNGVDGTMSAMLLVPDGLKEPAPTILWLHSSSYTHTQLLTPNTNGGEEPLGVTLVKRGYVVFAPDAAWYGDRAGQGPAGPSETTTAQQTSQMKLNLWFGRTLWGMFVRDDQVALDYLCTRKEVDTHKIGATGISMGSTRSWWLAAMDDRIAAVVGVACLTRYENLIKHGQLRQHGVYYFVNGLLKHFDTEAVVSLIAPRPALFLTGELDAGSPADGIRVIGARAGAVYAAVGSAGRFKSVCYPDVGHTYTPAMRAEMLAWFEKWLK